MRRTLQSPPAGARNVTAPGEPMRRLDGPGNPVEPPAACSAIAGMRQSVCPSGVCGGGGGQGRAKPEPTKTPPPLRRKVMKSWLTCPPPQLIAPPATRLRIVRWQGAPQHCRTRGAGPHGLPLTTPYAYGADPYRQRTPRMSAGMHPATNDAKTKQALRPKALMHVLFSGRREFASIASLCPCSGLHMAGRRPHAVCLAKPYLIVCCTSGRDDDHALLRQ